VYYGLKYRTTGMPATTASGGSQGKSFRNLANKMKSWFDQL
jgi:hypothetical protein